MRQLSSVNGNAAPRPELACARRADPLAHRYREIGAPAGKWDVIERGNNNIAVVIYHDVGAYLNL